jgi:hypothetical protein
MAIQKSVDDKAVFYYNDAHDHREAFQKTQNVTSFGLPKLGWAMIKEFTKRINGEMIVHQDHIELHFLTSENL